MGTTNDNVKKLAPDLTKGFPSSPHAMVAGYILAKRALDSITRDSGGLAFYPKSAAEVDALALQVAHEIRNQYTIAYSPTVPQMDGSFRQIKVTVNGPGHPLFRTRTGYYATPDASQKKTLSQLR